MLLLVIIFLSSIVIAKHKTNTWGVGSSQPNPNFVLFYGVFVFLQDDLFNQSSQSDSFDVSMIQYMLSEYSLINIAAQFPKM